MTLTPDIQTTFNILSCTKCDLSSKCRSPVPFSPPQSTSQLPPANPRVYQCGVLGEAPGRREDKLGRPFVGPAGRLMRRMLDEAGWNSDDLWYMNAVSCWPRGTPKAEAQNACWGNMLDQL